MPELDKQLFYEGIADHFDSLMYPHEVKKRLQLITTELLGSEDLAGKRVLDAGCGTGWFSQAVCERGAQVTALDIGPRLVAQMREKCDADPVVGSTLELPFADGRFDVVISTEVIEHTPDPRAAVAELTRVLSPGGLLVLTVPCWSWKWSVILASLLGIRPYEGHENWVGYFQLRRWLRDEGLIVEQYFGFNLLPLLFSWTPKIVDKLGGLLGPLMINIASRSRKP